MTLPDADTVAIRELGTDEHRFAGTRFLLDLETRSRQRIEPLRVITL